MIYYLKRKQLNTEKYDACITSAVNSRIYAYSWYLDIVADNWDALVLNDYEAVMPLPWRKKYFIKYVYTPFWVLQLGIFSNDKSIDSDAFLSELFKRFRYVDLRMNSGNSFQKYNSKRIKRQMQYLSLNNSYDKIFSGYNRNRKRELRKAKESVLIEKWNEKPEQLISLFKNNVGKRVSKINEGDYEKLLKLMTKCIDKSIGELVTVYSKEDKLIASAFFLKHKDKITELVCSSDFNNRNNGANTFMNERAIYKYQKKFEVFNFGGSSMEKIANYYCSFGAESEKYFNIEYNNLPMLLKFFKS